MVIAAKLAEWVQKNPIILLHPDEELSEALYNSRNGFEHFTIVERHSIFNDSKFPTICLLEFQSNGGSICKLGTVTKKVAVSTVDSRVTIKKLRDINVLSLTEIGSKISDKRMQNSFYERNKNGKTYSALSPKLSSHVIEILSQDKKNKTALDTAFSMLPRLRKISPNGWAQEDAIQSAMAAFGLQTKIATEVVIKDGMSSGLGLIGGEHLYEDNVVHFDASQLPGFDRIALDVTGRAVFEKGDERLVIYTANKLPLEKMLGVDLIYINETRGNIIMIQYKMLEEADNGADADWIFRPDKQLNEEIGRMQNPSFQGELTDYRLSCNPFFFKFVKRKKTDESHQSFLISLEHLKQLLAAPTAQGPRGGIRVSYNALGGTYLRQADIISLISSGYIGTHRVETKALEKIIGEAAGGNRALVLAWQQKLQV